MTPSATHVFFHLSDEAIDDEVHVIKGGGEIDLHAAPEFRERLHELIDAGERRLVIDISEATFIDSTAVGVLMGGLKRLGSVGGSLAVVCDDENVLKIFEIMGVDWLIPIRRSRDEAISAMARAG
jgi:anti-sigma B factor antagonist